MNLKTEEKYENEKIKNLIEMYPDSKEVEWYLNEFDYHEYFDKFSVKGWGDLEKRYNWELNAGRIKQQASRSTLIRMCKKDFKYIENTTFYPLVLLLYDCFVNENIKSSLIENRKKCEIESRKKSEIKGTQEETELNEWIKTYDIKEFCRENGISVMELAKKLNMPQPTLSCIVNNKRARIDNILKIKKFVENMKENEEEQNIMKSDNDTITKVTVNTSEVKIANKEDVLRNLLKNRLTEEERELIRIFGGEI